MNTITSTFRQLMVSCVLLSFSVGIYTPGIATNTVPQVHPITADSIGLWGIEDRALPPDIGGEMPALPMAAAAADDEIEVAEGATATTLVGGQTSVLYNDTPTGVLTATLETAPTHGSLQLNSDGTFEYTHDGTENFTDSFIYSADDGDVPDNATVNITITPVNDPPVANNDSLTVAEGGTATILTGDATSVLTNDNDPENVALTASIDTPPANGTLNLAPAGTFSYTHNGGETTTDSFIYIASDGVLTDTATVDITITPVNDPPVATDDSLTVAEGGTATILTGDADSVLANDTDPDNVTLTANVDTLPVNGTLALGSDGTFNYTHNGGETTTDSFIYIASDGVLTDTATVNITITPVNDPPVANNDSLTVAEGDTATILTGGATSVLTNDTDPDTVTLTAIVDTLPVNGTLILGSDGTFTYTPNGGESISDSFDYIASDGVLTDTATVDIVINRAPNPMEDAMQVAEGGTVTTLLGGAASLLANDSDPNIGTTLTTTIDTNVTNGSLSLNLNGTFSYTHNGGETTTDSFIYIASDGVLTDTAAVNITITPVNDPPTANNDSLIVAEGGTASILTGDATSVLTNDTDPDNDPLTLTASVDTFPVNGTLTLGSAGTFSYTHNGGETTSDSFVYIASDGVLTDTAKVNITITPVNDPPVAVDDSYKVTVGETLVIPAPGILTNDSDPDDLSLIAIIDSDPYTGTLNLNIDGSFDYKSGNETGIVSFIYRACDDNTPEPACDLAIVHIEVKAANLAPVAQNDYATTDEDTSVAINVLSNDSDPEGYLDPGSVYLVTYPVSGTTQVNLNTGVITYIPNLNVNGTDTFNYQVCDLVDDQRGICVSATVTVTINPVNDLPVAHDDSYKAVLNQTLVVPAPGVLSNDSDIETKELTAILLEDVSVGSLTLMGNGSFTYQPPDDYIGIASFSYKASDGSAESGVSNVTITVGSDDLAPTITWISPGIQPGEWVDVGPMIFPLIVDAKDNVQVAYVNFRRWDPSLGDNGDWVFLGSVSAEPFRLDLDTSTLQLGYNQITAEAFDTSGNYSESYIFLKRWGGLVELPLIIR